MTTEEKGLKLLPAHLRYHPISVRLLHRISHVQELTGQWRYAEANQDALCSRNECPSALQVVPAEILAIDGNIEIE